MFFNTNQYPALAHLPVAERKKVVAVAAKSENPWIGRRFAIAIAFVAITTIVFGLRQPPLTNVQLLVGAAVTGAIFYLYLLFEINGPLRKSVEAHLKKASHRK